MASLATKLASASLNRTFVTLPAGAAGLRTVLGRSAFYSSDDDHHGHGHHDSPATPTLSALKVATPNNNRSFITVTTGSVGAGEERQYHALEAETKTHCFPPIDIDLAPAGISIQKRFKHTSARETTQIPDFSKYKSGSGDSTNRGFSYFMVGTTGALSFVGAKTTVADFLANMSASADVLALAKVEVDLNTIPEGRNVTIKWRGKPVFIRHRTADEIDEANSVNIAELRDPQNDAERAVKPEWLVMLGVCTHLGCVPIGEAGDYGGWYCPCHGSHYDISGRIRKGPAPLNLEIPAYSFEEGNKIVIG
ncbi:hypothetical protein BGZ93_010851 [Podila epicladia]|nr:hypothetical protein BGZ93_010851 [Podila epicladia]